MSEMVSSLWERSFNSVPDLIAILDCNHRIVRVNQPMADKLGQTPGQCVGQTCYECVHGTHQPPAFCPHSLTLADGQSHTAEVHDDRLGGYVLVTATPLLAESGEVIGCIHVARDINEQKRIQEILRHLLEASDHQRHLISCEIHDGLAQYLAGAIMQFEAFKSLQDANPRQAAKALDLGMHLLRKGNVEARRLIGGLRPPQLKEEGVLGAIQSLVEEWEKRNKIKIQFRSTVSQLEMAPMLENTVFRIVQECVTNACRHSKSKKVNVELTQHGDRLKIRVRDWGVGFRIDRVEEGHFGLEGIQERARIFGGHATIKSSPGKGTDIVVELPLRSSMIL